MIGDPTLFMRADMVEQSWRIVQPVLDAWAAEKVDFPDYDSGSDGPKAADELLARGGDGRRRLGTAPHQRRFLHCQRPVSRLTPSLSWCAHSSEWREAVSGYLVTRQEGDDDTARERDSELVWGG